MAKEDVKKKISSLIIEALGPMYQGTLDKKIYACTGDNGENVQVAISLTCPKVQKEFGSAFDPPSGNRPVVRQQPVDYNITPEEKEKVVDIMAKLGL